MSGSNGDGQRPTLPAGRYIELEGRGRTFVREQTGPDGAPVVVLLHGWTATAALNWSPSFAPLGNRFQVLALDQRGHGRGLRSRAPFRLEDCADDIAALLGAVGVERCIAVGYSMGGPVAQLLWQRHPQLVDGMVLCATAASFKGTPRELLLATMATGGSIVADTLRAPPIALAVRTAIRGWGRVRPSSWWGLDEISGHDWAQIVEAGRAICRFDSRPWVLDTSVPTAVIATQDDDVVPHQRQLALAGAIPGASVRAIDGGHSACTTAPERFVAALVDACVEVAERATHPVRSRVVDRAA